MSVQGVTSLVVAVTGLVAAVGAIVHSLGVQAALAKHRQLAHRGGGEPPPAA